MAKRSSKRRKPERQAVNGGSGKRPSGPNDFRTLVVRSFEITFDPLPDPEVEALPEKVRDQMDRIRAKAHRHGHDCVTDETEFLHRRYPHIPCFANWLAMCHRAAGREDEYRALVLRIAEDYPDYLFGRLALAELLLNDLDLEGAENALGLRAHPGDIVPGRERYHISEVRYYFFLCGKYHFLDGDLEAARTHLKILQDIEPDSAAAKELSRLLDKPELALIASISRRRKRFAGR